MPGAHHILSCSGASRWMACTPSARLEAALPERTSTYAEEGTRAHACAEKWLVRYFAHATKTDSIPKLWSAIKADLILEYGIEMVDNVEVYTSHFVELYMGYLQHGPVVPSIETTGSLDPYIPGGFGSRDGSLVSRALGVAHIADLKYGQGVMVTAENNTQLKLYGASLVLDLLDLGIPIHTVRMTIVMPRLGSITTAQISADELMHWLKTEVAQKAAMAWEGKGPFLAGKHCKFCKLAGTCKAETEYNRNRVAEQMALTEAALRPQDRVTIKLMAESIREWLTRVEDRMLVDALNGVDFPGLKLVAGRANRKYSDEDAVIRVLQGDYAEDSYVKKKLIGIGDLEKLVGKDYISAHLSELIVKPEGSPTLVPEDDKRPAIKGKRTASEAFADFIQPS